MTKEEFQKYYNHLMQMAARDRKAGEAEYSSIGDVLRNIRMLATFRNQSSSQILMNQVAKRIGSISLMVDEEFGSANFPLEPTPIADIDRKFTGAINYLLKLYASIREARE